MLELVFRTYSHPFSLFLSLPLSLSFSLSLDLSPSPLSLSLLISLLISLPLLSLSFSLKVLTLRTVHEHLLRLLSTNEQTELRLTEAFTPFAGLHPLHPNPYTQPLWKAAVAQYERAMAAPEQRIAGKLRQQFQQAEARPHQLLREFKRYKELVKRPLISKELVTERYHFSSFIIFASSFFLREMLLGQLSAHIKMIKDDFSSRTVVSPTHLQQSNEPVPPTGKNMPQVVNTIVWIRQLEAKVSLTLHLFCNYFYHRSPRRCPLLSLCWATCLDSAHFVVRASN